MKRTEADRVIQHILDDILSDESYLKKDIHVEMAQESKKLYDAHIKVGFTAEQTLALTCAILQ